MRRRKTFSRATTANAETPSSTLRKMIKDSPVEAKSLAQEMLNSGDVLHFEPFELISQIPSLRKQAWEKFTSTHRNDVPYIMAWSDDFADWGWEAISKNPTPLLLIWVVNYCSKFAEEAIRLIPSAIQRASKEEIRECLLSGCRSSNPYAPQLKEAQELAHQLLWERIQKERIRFYMGGGRFTIPFQLREEK